MGLHVAAACMRRGMTLADVALTGPGMPGTVAVDDQAGGAAQHVALFAGPGADGAEAAVAGALAEARAANKVLVAIDFTHPTAVNVNGDLYKKLEVPFVMGTTGGDREALARTVEEGRHAAVIAPNMSKQIVAMQACLERMAVDFPGSFGGYTLTTTESHQSAKADTSGTAKAVVGSLTKLVDAAATPATVDAAIGAINLVRDEPRQLTGDDHVLTPVTPSALAGHAYHTYRLGSDDGTVEFQLRHNVDGRRTYAEGTADAVMFLARRCAAAAASPECRDDPARKRLFNMIDVLEAGEM